MIDIGKILKRGWHILWNYRILWVFGFLLAITMGNSNGPSSNSRYEISQNEMNTWTGTLPSDSPQWLLEANQWYLENVQPLFVHPEQHISTFVTIGLIFFGIMLLCGLLTAFVRYPAETAVIRMVDEYEQSGSKLKFGEGWKLGWNRRAFRLWVIDLILAIPALLLFLMIVGTGVIVYFSVSATFQITSPVGIVAAIGLGFLALFLLIVVAILMNLIRNFFVRAAALEGLGIGDSLKRGWGMFKRNWKSAGLLWLVMIAIGIAVGIVLLVVVVILVPLYLIMVVPGVLVASLPALIAYGITSLFTSGPLAWLIAVLAALPFFFLTVFAPLLLVSGWVTLYTMNVWTLAYREINAAESLAGQAAPSEPAPSNENETGETASK